MAQDAQIALKFIMSYHISLSISNNHLYIIWISQEPPSVF